ncbi:BsuPI-related putative proteinase inhibitor [Alkalihalobacterium alkalinitrilicum]|uniref:BsuPI-related putative proteinase inhibitor n=1 Tax=Alkalihalobacterium alkalinitrilicum TaxID=427920 RepID=UPI001C576E1D|nr:BsuPI-related putative proteinase inhibitor [Alkalihalobacterium alkalinitrilicum]
MKVLFLLVFAFFLTGCGLGNEQASQEPTTGGSEIVDGEMTISLVEESPLVFHYEVMNQSDKVVTIEFSSSQRINYSITTKEGKDIYLFSSVATFLQALGEEELKPDEQLEYVIDLNELDLQEGEYLLSVWLTPMDGPTYKIIKEFTIE